MSYITNVEGPSASSPNDPNDYQPTNKWSFGQDDLKEWISIGGNLISNILQGVSAFRLSGNNQNQNNQNNNGNGNNNGNNGYNNQGGADWSLAIIIGFVVLVLAVLVFLIIKASK